jgi:hypothetical protein
MPASNLIFWSFIPYTQPPVQWVIGALSLGVKRPGHEADHSPASSTEAKEWFELYLHLPNNTSQRGAQVKHRDFTFTFYFTRGALWAIYWQEHFGPKLQKRQNKK